MNIEKLIVFERVAALLDSKNIQIASTDFTRPWGGFFVIDTNEDSVKNFIDTFYLELKYELDGSNLHLSPKILSQIVDLL